MIGTNVLGLSEAGVLSLATHVLLSDSKLPPVKLTGVTCFRVTINIYTYSVFKKEGGKVNAYEAAKK